MIVKNANIKKAAIQAIEIDTYYDNIGVRVQDDLHGLSVGDIIERNSTHWISDDGKDAHDGEELRGVCAIEARQAKYLSDFGGYEGRVILILGSEFATGGFDDGEIIMERPEVLGIITS